MEQEYILKTKGGLSLFEQNQMTAETRAWWIKRIEKQIKDEQEAEKRSAPRNMPKMPRKR